MGPPRVDRFAGLAPGFAVRLFATVQAARTAGLPVAVFETLRSDDRQRWLFAAGRTRPGPVVTGASSALRSWHGFGLAADLAFGGPGRWEWPADGPEWIELETIAGRHGLRSGRAWHDIPHFQPANLKAAPSSRARELLATGGLAAVWIETGHADAAAALDDLNGG